MPGRRRRPSRPRYFLTVQVAQALDQWEDEAENVERWEQGAGAADGDEGAGSGGVGPVAYEFTLEGIDLLDTVATLRLAIEVNPRP